MQKFRYNKISRRKSQKRRVVTKRGKQTKNAGMKPEKVEKAKKVLEVGKVYKITGVAELQLSVGGINTGLANRGGAHFGCSKPSFTVAPNSQIPALCSWQTGIRIDLVNQYLRQAQDTAISKLQPRFKKFYPYSDLYPLLNLTINKINFLY